MTKNREDVIKDCVKFTIYSSGDKIKNSMILYIPEYIRKQHPEFKFESYEIRNEVLNRLNSLF